MGAKALGSGCSGEVEQAAALTHMLTMLQPHMSDLKRHVCEVRAVCTDLGTESWLANLHAPVENLVPSWYGALSIGLEADVSDVEGVSTQRGLQPDIEHFEGATAGLPALEHLSPTTAKGFLPLAIGVAGMEHITNNLTEENFCASGILEDILWPTQTCFLVARPPPSKGKICAALSWRKSSRASSVRIGRMVGSSLRERWGHVILFIRALLPVWPLLKAFNAHRYLIQLECWRRRRN
eukprot:239683-Amphidinium_carterae.1